MSSDRAAQLAGLLAAIVAAAGSERRMTEIVAQPYDEVMLPGDRLVAYHDGDEDAVIREKEGGGQLWWEFGLTTGTWYVRAAL